MHLSTKRVGQKIPAFTLVELLVVIAILGILAALILPALSRGRQKAQGVYCLNNGKQLMVALTLYTSDYHDLFPPNPDDANTIAAAPSTGTRRPWPIPRT